MPVYLVESLNRGGSRGQRHTLNVVSLAPPCGQTCSGLFSHPANWQLNEQKKVSRTTTLIPQRFVFRQHMLHTGLGFWFAAQAEERLSLQVE